MPEIREYENVDWELVSSVKASERRTQVLQSLDNQPMMNSELADELGLSTAWVRQQVKWLEERQLVEDLTETKHNYKLYGVTEEGKQIVEVL
jgi:predicted transcriptional regulator